MSATAAPTSIMPASRLPTPASRFSLFPRSRLPPRLLVQEQDHRPDLALGEEILPHGHRRVPRRALARQPGPALRDTPEHEALGQLRDGAVVLEVSGQRVEAGREVSLAVQMVAVARQTVLVVDALPLRQIRGKRVRGLA